MRNIVVYGTKTGTTKKVAEIIQGKLKNTEIVNVNEISKITDLKVFDNIIIGSNVRMGRFNKNIISFLKRKSDLLLAKKVFGFVVAAGEEKETEYVENLRVLIQGDVVYVGGNFDLDAAKGFDRFMIKVALKDIEKKGQKLPSINMARIDKLIEMITVKQL